MTSLARHLRQPGSHDHLPFHPACSACRRDRASRAIAEVPILTARMRAGLATAVIGASTIAAAVRSAAPAVAQTRTTTGPSDMAPKSVTPDELEQNLADPNRPDPRAPEAALRVVAPGDSLWTIAREALGGATRPTNERIATEVDRLWSLNSESVGTGNRDLIYPGQELKLR